MDERIKTYAECKLGKAPYGSIASVVDKLRAANVQYGDGIPKAIQEEAASGSLIICYGYSDDLIEFRGAIDDEGGCYDGGIVTFNNGGISQDERELEYKIEAIWCPKNAAGVAYSEWDYKAEFPMYNFNIYDGNNLYCVGKVFSLEDVRKSFQCPETNSPIKVNESVLVRPLFASDEEAVKKLDNLSGNQLAAFISKMWSDYAYGIFVKEPNGEKLIGYLSAGYADGCEEQIENHRLHSHDSILISDVYITESERGNGYGRQLVASAIVSKLFSEGINTTFFIELLDDELSDFYESIGFKWCDDSEQCCMYYNFFSK